MRKERLTCPNLYILGDAPAAAPSGREARDTERPPPGAGGALLGVMFDGEYMGGEQGGSAGARRLATHGGRAARRTSLRQALNLP